jgi:hypothetical protein
MGRIALSISTPGLVRKKYSRLERVLVSDMPAGNRERYWDFFYSAY